MQTMVVLLGSQQVQNLHFSQYFAKRETETLGSVMGIYTATFSCQLKVRIIGGLVVGLWFLFPVFRQVKK